LKTEINHQKFVILGAGLSGLCAAYFLQTAGLNDFTLLEKNRTVGGLCRSHTVDGFTFDYTGHLLHSHNPFVINFIKKILKSNHIEHRRNSAVVMPNAFIPYPFQFNLSYLPDKIKNECVSGFIKSCNRARHIKIHKSDKSELLKKSSESDKCDNFDNWLKMYFGRGIYKYFMKPYNSKFWRTALNTITTDWFDKYIPQPTLEDILKSSTSKNYEYSGYNSNFYYPLKNGIGALINGIQKHISQRALITECDIQKIDIRQKKIYSNRGVFCYEYLITTIPLPEFLCLIANSRTQTDSLSRSLDYVSVYNINYGLETKINNPYHWLYFPDKTRFFYRIGFYHNFSRYATADNSIYQSAYIEISYKSKLKYKLSELHKQIKSQFLNFGLYDSKSAKIITEFPLDIRYGYVVHNKQRVNILRHLTEFFIKSQIIPIGRYAEWTYSSMQDSIITAHKKISELVK